MERDEVIATQRAGEPALATPGRKAYRRPTLTRYGSVQELTTQEGMSPIAGLVLRMIDIGIT